MHALIPFNALCDWRNRNRGGWPQNLTQVLFFTKKSRTSPSFAGGGGGGGGGVGGEGGVSE